MGGFRSLQAGAAAPIHEPSAMLVQSTCNDCAKQYWYDPADGYKNRCNKCQANVKK